MSRSNNQPLHTALLLKLTERIGCTPAEIGRLIANARGRVIEFCAARVALPTLREIRFAALIETLS